jgi:hypothetical protein
MQGSNPLYNVRQVYHVVKGLNADCRMLGFPSQQLVASSFFRFSKSVPPHPNGKRPAVANRDNIRYLFAFGKR